MKRASAPAELDIRIGRLDELFQTFDPAPFRGRDLDPAATQYIVDWARELHRKVPLAIRVHVQTRRLDQETVEHVRDAVSAYFTYRAAAAERDLRRLFGLGRIYLLIGLPILALTLAGAELITLMFGTSRSLSILAESLIILGWVANWRPLETFLYEWWPIRRDVLLFRRLAAAEVTVEA